MGPMGIANAQRALEYIRIPTELISQPEYSNIIHLSTFGIVNDAVIQTIRKDAISHFYLICFGTLLDMVQAMERTYWIHNGFCFE